MALTLPYPNIVFVPLDVLTAEEQNQLVANIEEIANQFPIGAANIAANAVTSGKIASSAVTSTKIDWSTISGNTSYINFGSKKIAWGSQSFTVATDYETQVTINFPATFNNTPNVVACPGSWIARPFVMVTDITTTGFTAVLRHDQGTSKSFTVRYIAIG